MEQVERAGESQRGVWRCPHKSLNRRPFVYATDDEGCIVGWLEFGPDVDRTEQEATAKMRELIDDSPQYARWPRHLFVMARVLLIAMALAA